MGATGRQERRFDPEIQIAGLFVCLTKNALQVEVIEYSYSVIPRFLTHTGGSFNVVYKEIVACVSHALVGDTASCTCRSTQIGDLRHIR